MKTYWLGERARTLVLILALFGVGCTNGSTADRSLCGPELKRTNGHEQGICAHQIRALDGLADARRLERQVRNAAKAGQSAELAAQALVLAVPLDPEQFGSFTHVLRRIARELVAQETVTATALHERAGKLDRLNGDPFCQARAFGALARHLARKGSLSDTRQAFRDEAASFRLAKHHLGASNAERLWGDFEERRGNPGTALERYQDSIRSHERLWVQIADDPTGRDQGLLSASYHLAAKTLLVMAQLHLKLGRFAAAAAASEKGLELARSEVASRYADEESEKQELSELARSLSAVADSARTGNGE